MFTKLQIIFKMWIKKIAMHNFYTIPVCVKTFDKAFLDN